MNPHEEPKFQWGQRVSAASDLYNDGSFPDSPADELLVKAGHSVIQNDTRHAWENRSAKNCVVAVAVIGAVHSR